MSIGLYVILCSVGFFYREHIANWTGLIDHPTGHKTHQIATPVIGGMILWVNFLVLQAELIPIGLWISLFILVVIGAWDDIFSLNWFSRSIAQSLAAVILINQGSELVHLGNLFSFGPVTLVGVLSPIVTYIAYMSLMNGHNMLDGLDGLFASIGIVQLCCLCAVTYTIHPACFIANGTLAVGLMVFLLWNQPKDRSAFVFMGDQGTYALGLWNTYWAIELSQHYGISPVLMLWIFMWPIFEMMFSLLRRVRATQSPTRPDRQHLHHLLQNAGYSSQTVSKIYMLVQIVAFTIGHDLLKINECVSFICFLIAFIMYMVFWKSYHRDGHSHPTKA